MLKSLQKKLAIDLGSQKIKIAVLDEVISSDGNLLSRSFSDKVSVDYACVARKKSDSKILAFAQEAYEMRGRLDEDVEIIFPFESSRIMDLDAAQALLKFLLNKTIKGRILSPVVMVTTVTDISDFSKEKLSQLFYDLNFSEVYLIAQPLAAAVGAGVPVADSSGTLFFQMGASNSELAVMALASISSFRSSKFAALKLNEKIGRHLARKEKLLLGIDSIEKIKKEIASVDPDFTKELSITAKSLETSAPIETKINSQMIWPVMDEFRKTYLSLIKSLLKEIPPELTEDILDKGLLLSGSLAQLDGLEDYFVEELGIPVAVVDDPELTALRGAALMLDSLKLFKSSLAFES